MYTNDPLRTSRRLVLVACLVAATAVVSQAKAPKRGRPDLAQRPTIAKPAPERPRIDVVFALDTTGSMSGLIEGAKQ